MAWDTDLDPNGVTNANAAASGPRVRLIGGSESHIHDLIMPTAARRSNGEISVVANVRFGSKTDSSDLALQPPLPALLRQCVAYSINVEAVTPSGVASFWRTRIVGFRFPRSMSLTYVR